MSNQVVIHKIYSPLAIRKRALDYANRPEPTAVSKGKYGATVGGLTTAVKICLGLDQSTTGEKKKLSAAQTEQVENSARCVLAWLFQDEGQPFSPISRGSLSPQQINGLGRWKTELKGQQWVERRMFKDELTWMIFWSTLAEQWTNEGRVILFQEVLERCNREGVASNDEDYHGLHSYEQFINMKFNESQTPPEPIMIPDEDGPGLPDGACWCEWCGEVITAPGIPCFQCQKLGAPAEAKAEPVVQSDYNGFFDVL